MDTITITVAENDPDVIVSATLNEDAVTITLNEAAVGATGAGVAAGGSANDILKKTSATNYATAWETPTSAATANTVVRRDASGGAAFDDLTAATVVFTGSIQSTAAGAFISTTGYGAAITTEGDFAGIGTNGFQSYITTGGTDSFIATLAANSSIFTSAANSPIYTSASDSNIETYHASASVRSYNFAALDATAGASLRNSAGTAILTWGATAGNISITVNTTSTGHFFSNPSTSEAGHFITKNGTTPTIAAGRSAWFSDSSGAPQFKNGTGSAVTLLYNGGPLGTPSSGTLTSCTGLPISTGVSGLGTGVATLLTGTPSGTGGPVGTTSPTITTPTFTRSGNGTIITASESSRTITCGTASYGVELVLTTATGSQGAYGTFSGMLEAFVAVNASSNTSGQRWMRFGNKANRFTIQRLTDGGAALTATPFSFANDAPENAFYMNSSGGVTLGATTDAGATNLLVAGSSKSNGGFIYGTFTVGTFPATTYLEAVVTDALSPVVGVAVAAGGSAKCKVMYNGSAKIVTAVL
jgi:hypothetical protein